jgi:hypothetical protein
LSPARCSIRSPRACTAANEPLESSRGTAVGIVDDVDALEAAMEEAEDHCDRYDRHPVLQSVSPVDRDELLATFDCVEPWRRRAVRRR